jgi:hypothetical protein
MFDAASFIDSHAGIGVFASGRGSGSSSSHRKRF